MNEDLGGGDKIPDALHFGNLSRDGDDGPALGETKNLPLADDVLGSPLRLRLDAVMQHIGAVREQRARLGERLIHQGAGDEQRPRETGPKKPAITRSSVGEPHVRYRREAKEPCGVSGGLEAWRFIRVNERRPGPHGSSQDRPDRADTRERVAELQGRERGHTTRDAHGAHL